MKRKCNMAMKLAVVTSLSLAMFTSTVAAEQETVTESTEASEETEETVAESAEASEETAETVTEAAGETAETDAAGTGIAAVTELTAGESTIFVCYPENNANDTLGVKTTCTAPVFLVYGEGKYDEASAEEYAVSSGLASIAAAEGSSVIVVNPIGDTWSEADAETYTAIIDMISDSSTAETAKGLSTSVSYTTGEEETNITGTTGRVYVYATGAGADFALANLVKEIEGSVTYGDGVTITFNNTIAGATLSGLSTADQMETVDFPIVSIGNSDEINSVLEENAGSFLAADTEDYAAQYEEVIGKNRRQAGVLVPVYDWEEEGIVEKIETTTVTTSPDNTTFADTESHEVNYVTYYAEDLDVENGNVPLVLCFHGGGNTALYEAQATEWPLIGKENGFITVSVDMHYPNMTAAETIELIEQLEEEYSIDSTRIYASGFSMGGAKSWDLYEQYPEVFAGLAPMDASFEPGIDSFSNEVESTNTDTIVPVFYVGGETSPLSELPCQSETLVNRVKALFATNQVEKAYDVSFDAMDTWENAIWGIDGDDSYTVEDTEKFTDSVLTVQLFNSTDGNCYTALASASNQSHEVYGRNSRAAWDFLSKFSRAEDGSIVIAE